MGASEPSPLSKRDRAGDCTRDVFESADRSRRRINNITHVIVIVQENHSFVTTSAPFPGARTEFPRDAHHHIDVCVPDPQAGGLWTALSRHGPVRRGRPPRTGRLHDRSRRGADGRIRRRSTRSATDASTTPTSSSAGRPSRCRAASRTSWDTTRQARSRTTRRMRTHFVPQDHMFAPESSSTLSSTVPGVGLAGHLLTSAIAISFRSDLEFPGRTPPITNEVWVRDGDASAVHLGRHHLAAAPAPRQLGVYVGSATCLDPRLRPFAGPGGHRAVRTGCPGSGPSRSIISSRTSSRTRTTSGRGGRTLPAVSWVIPTTSRESTRRTTSATVSVGDAGRQRGDPRAGLRCTPRSSSRRTTGEASTTTSYRPRWTPTATDPRARVMNQSVGASRFIDHQTLFVRRVAEVHRGPVPAGRGSIHGPTVGPMRARRSARIRRSSASLPRVQLRPQPLDPLILDSSP